jgi:O-antigen/teichoic acid export membrane protein
MTDYGALAILEASVLLIVGIIGTPMLSSLTRWYWDKEYIEQQKSIFFSSLAFLFIVTVPIIYALIHYADFFSILLFKTVSYSLILKFTFLSVAFRLLNNQILNLAKLQSKSVLYSSALILKLILTLGIILWGILLKGYGLIIIWQANAIGEFVILLVLIPFVLKNIRISFQKTIIKEMLAYGTPLMLAATSGVILAVTDRYMLNSMSGLEKTGIYTLGFRIANTLKIVISTSLGMALTPILMKKINEKGSQRFYSKVMTYSGYIFIIGLLALSMFSLEILKVFTGSAKYWAANGVIPLVSFALFFGLIKDNVTIGLIIRKKTKVIGLLIFITSILNIVLNMLFIPIWGIYGAALATLCSQIFFFITMAVQAQKAYFIPYEWKKLLILLLLAAVFLSFGLAISNLSIVFRLLIKVALFISFPFALRLFNFYDDIELVQIKAIYKTWRNPQKLKENIKRILK